MSDLSRTIAELTPEQRALLELRLRRKRAAAPARALTIEPRADRGSFPFSFAQQRLWFLDQLEPGSPLYVVPSVLRIRGRLDVAALERSFAAVIARHEALRAAFVTLDGQAVQVVLPELDLPLPVADLRDLPEEEREAEALDLARRDARQPFDLSHAPLLRSSLVRLADEEYLWLLSLHHIVSDGWSVGVLVRELVAAYEAFSASQKPALSDLPLQYADFAAWQRERLSGEALEIELAYWRRRLGQLPSLELPADRPRPAEPTFRGSRLSFSFPAPLAASLAALGQAEGATSFMTLLAGFTAVLGAWTGQDDVTVGSPIANRNRFEIEGLIGFFVNTLVVRTDLGGDPTFRQLLRRVRDASVEDFNHQDVPFEKLVEELRPERALGQSPLFQVLFAVQNAPRPALRIPGLAVEPLEIDNGTAKFDLGLFLVEAGGEIVGAFEYSAELFDPRRIERLAGHLRQLLEAAVAAPDRRLSELPLLSEAETRQIRAWNDTRAERTGPVGLHDLFERQAKRTPEATALVFEDRSMTYAELDDRSNRLARHLQALGVRPGRPVGLCVERSPEMLVGLLAILKNGAPYVPLDPSYPADRLFLMIGDAGIDALVTQERLAAAFPAAGVPVVRLDTNAEAIASRSGAQLSGVEVGPDDLVYIMFTSGSTGRPKGVAMNHGVVSSLVEWQERTVLPGAARALQFSPLGFDVSCQEIFSTLGAGGTLVLVSEDVRRDPVALLRLLDRERVERLYLPFVAMQQLAVAWQDAGVACAALRDVATAGEQLQVNAAVRAWFEALPGCRLHNQYGPTETHVVTALTLDGAPSSWPALPTIGRPVANARIELLGADLRQAPVGVPGELYIGGSAVSRGYAGRPDLTAERFVPDPYGGEPGARLYRTGDLARWREDGEVEFLGRADHQVKIRGFRVEPGEIESLLGSHPAVREAVVVARDEGGDRRLVAYVVPVAEGAGRELRELTTALQAFLRERLPDYMVPSAFMTLPALPWTPSGKVDRRRLPTPERDVTETAGAPLEGAVQELLAGIWSELLKIGPVAASDHFFDLGGHSLLATRLVARVRELFGVEIPLRAVFEHPTLEAFSRAIGQARGLGVPPPPVRPLPREDAFPLSFAQERLWFLEQLEGAAGAYNLPSAVRLSGHLDVAALAESLRELVRRHEALRTVFPLVEGRPAQVIRPAANLTLPLVDLEAVPQALRGTEVERLAAAEASRPFDLAHGPLLRSALLRLAGDEHVLLLGLHHIVADGWSFGVLLREIATLLPALSAGSHSDLPMPPVQYADYTVWQREWLHGETLEKQLAYWRGQLAGSPPVLDLPMDRPRPAVQTFRGDTRFVPLGGELSTALGRAARREGCTQFMALLAAFDAVLLRHTGRADLIVGTPVAGRTRPELESVVGCFINTLALRTDLSGEPTLREAMRRVRATTLGAYDHQDIPFARVVEELLSQRDLSYSPVFQVQLSLQNAYTPLRELDGLDLEPVDFEGKTARFDLSLTVEEGSAGLVAALNYNTDLFDGVTVDRLLGHWRNLLAAMAEVDRRLSDLPLLGTAETHQLLVEANDTAEELAAPLSIHRLFELQAERTPDAEAMVFRGAAISYAELDARANRLARRLRRYGVGPEVPVGVFLERTTDLPVALLGILKAGGAYLPLDPSYPAERLAFMLEDARVPVLVSQESLLGRLPAADVANIAVLSLDAAESLEVLAAESPEALPEREPGTLAYLIYTSGSTGRPKGVMVSHRNAANFFAGMDRRLRPDPERPGTWLAVTSVSFDISVLELLWTLARGFRVVLHADDARTVALSGSTPVSHTAARRLDFSLFYFANDEAESDSRKYRLLMEGARFADCHGFAAVWTPERHFHTFGGLYPNPAVVGAAVAAVTERVKIRAGSVVLPLQDPLRVAEEWSVVDNLSGGRAGVSFASGWHADDFVLAPQSYRQRKDVMFRGVETVRRLWRGEAVERENGTGQTIEVRIRPRPLQPELPFWVTAGGSPETFRMAGEIGAGLLTHLLGQSLEDLAAKITVYRTAWRQAGHPGEGHVTLMLHTFVGDDPAEVRETVREPFRNYLRTSVDLLSNLARGLRQKDLAQLPPEDVEMLLDHAFERYFESSALFGTPERCLRLAERVKEIGCDEIGCLIDFGVDADRALAGLEKLDEVRRASEAATARAAQPVETLPELLRRHAVTHLQGTPSLISMLATDADGLAALGGLSHLLVGGEPFPVPLARKLRASLPGEIHNVYGPTETTVWSATHHLADVDGRVPVGRAIANTGLYVLEDQLSPVPHGVAGELHIGGEGVTRGYLGRPEATAASYLPDPFSGLPGARLYRTGDLARSLPDGTLEILGRRDSQVKIRGYRIELGEIEARLARHPDVRQAAVAVVGSTGEDRRLAAYVVPHQGTQGKAIDPERAQALLGDRPGFTLPNGMLVASLSHLQTSQLYREIFREERYLQYGITLEDGDCVFDVGANIGFFTLWAGLSRRDVRLFSFEPIPPTFDYLRTNAALYDLGATVVNAGLSSRRESAEFTFYRALPGLSGRYADLESDRSATRAIVLESLREGAEGIDRSVFGEREIEEALDDQFRHETWVCELRTLSDVMAEHGVERIDLLKVDVERSEVDVLAGVRDEDWPKIRQIVIEVDGRDNQRILESLLESKGYDVTVDTRIEVPASDGSPEVYIALLYAVRRGMARVPRRRPEEARQPGALSAELRTFLQASLPEYMVPSAFVVLDALPLTPNGKVDRRALPAPGAAVRPAAAAYVPPENETEHVLAEIWRESLHLDRLGVGDNFFEAGGNSLLMAQMLVRVREAFQRDLAIVELFRHPTVRSLARFLDGDDGGDGGVGAAMEKAADRGQKVSGSVRRNEALQRQRMFMESRRRPPRLTAAATATATEAEPE